MKNEHTHTTDDLHPGATREAPRSSICCRHAGLDLAGRRARQQQTCLHPLSCSLAASALRLWRATFGAKTNLRRARCPPSGRRASLSPNSTRASGQRCWSLPSPTDGRAPPMASFALSFFLCFLLYFLPLPARSLASFFPSLFHSRARALTRLHCAEAQLASEANKFERGAGAVLQLGAASTEPRRPEAPRLVKSTVGQRGPAPTVSSRARSLHAPTPIDCRAGGARCMVAVGRLGRLV